MMDTGEIKELSRFGLLPLHLQALQRVDDCPDGTDPEVVIAEKIQPYISDLYPIVDEQTPVINPNVPDAIYQHIMSLVPITPERNEFQQLHRLKDIIRSEPNLATAKAQYVEELGLSDCISFAAGDSDDDSVWDVDEILHRVTPQCETEMPLTVQEAAEIYELGTTVTRSLFTIQGIAERINRRRTLSVLKKAESDLTETVPLSSRIRAAGIYHEFKTGQTMSKRIAKSNRRDFKRAALSLKSSNTDPITYFAQRGITEADIQEIIAGFSEEKKKSHRVVAMLGAIGFFGLIIGSTLVDSSASPTSASVTSNIEVSTTIPTTKIETNLKQHHANATIHTSSDRTTVNTLQFDQVHFGTRKTVTVLPGQDWDDIVAIVRQQSGDPYDVKTLLAFNFGELTPLYPGMMVRYTDCPKQIGKLIVAGGTTQSFAAEHGLTVNELNTLNGGTFRNYSGICGRVEEGEA